MGKGIALTFKNKYPKMFIQYQAECKLGFLKPGNFTQYNISDNEVIWNLATKNDWRKPSEYKWIESSLKQIRKCLLARNINRPDLENSLVMPAIGCGNGSLDWAVVKDMIQEVLGDLPNRIVVFEPNKGF